MGLFEWGPRRLFPIDFLIRPAWLWASQDASFRVLEHLLTPDPLEMVVAIWICCNDQAAMKARQLDPTELSAQRRPADRIPERRIYLQ